jgi:ribosomal protein S14
MKHSAAIDRLARRRLCAVNQYFRTSKSVRSNSFFSSLVRAQAAKQLFLSPPFTSRLRNFCSLTSRSRGILREFKLSRFSFKRLVGLRYVFGVRRSSW